VESERKKVAELQEAPEKCASEIKELEEKQEDLQEKKQEEEKSMLKIMENIKSETEVSSFCCHSVSICKWVSVSKYVCVSTYV